jgi:hypothetical protein
VLSSDPLSSVAYATEEILRVLILAGAGTLWLVTPIGVTLAAVSSARCWSCSRSARSAS